MTRALLETIDEAYKRFGRERIEAALGRWYTELGLRLLARDDLPGALSALLKAGAFLRADFGYQGIFDPTLGVENCQLTGHVMTRLNRRAEAKYFFLKSFEANPKYVSSQMVVAETMARHGRPDEMRRYFEREIAEVPDSPLAAFFLDVIRLFPAIVDDVKQALSDGVGTPGRKRKLAVVMPVWGEKHIEQAGRYALPMLLAEGNLPALAKTFDLRFIFFTKDEDRERIWNLDCYDALSRVAGVYFVRYPETLMASAGNRVARLQITSLAHYSALEAVRQTDGVAAFAFPDNVINDNFFAVAGRRLEAGAGAVCCAGFRLLTEDILPTLDREFRGTDGLIRIPGQNLARLLLDHLPEGWFADADRFTRLPFLVCWREGRDTLHARASHFQPYVISGRHLRGPIYPSIDPTDARFLLRYAKNLDDIVFIEDEEMCIVDAGPQPLLDSQPIPSYSRFDERRFALFTLEYDSPLTRRCLHAPVRLRSSPSAAADEAFAGRIDGVVARVERVMDDTASAAPIRPEWALRADSEAW